MAGQELPHLPIARLASLIQQREVSPVEVSRAYLQRIEQHAPTLNAYITVMADEARQAAQQAEEEIAGGVYKGPLHGIPIALKDLYFTRGVRTTGGSRILADFIPEEDAGVTRWLREAGSIIIGKTNLHEFAFGVTNVNPHYGPCLNPWARERIPGGSSGGSGAAVSAGLCGAATGSDTGGSIRIPAALCGIVGLKPTYGRVSRRGILPLSWSLDHPGPMTRTVEDAALVLQAVAGWDPQDQSTSRLPVPDYRQTLEQGVEGLRVGVPQELFFEGLDPEVQRAVEQAINHLGELGAQVQDVSIPHIREATSASMPILLSEAYTYHQQYLKTRPEEYGEDVRNRVEVGAFISATDFVQAQRVRHLLKQEMAALFEGVDVLVTPTVPIPAPEVGVFLARGQEQALETRNALSRFTSPFNVTGLPALSVPCGFTSQGLPIGLQLVGRPYEESTVLRAGHAYETTTEWHTRRPPGV